MVGIGKQIEERLETLWGKVAEEFELADSRVRPGVKTGRSRKGTTWDRYISYKNATGINVGLAVFQYDSTGPIVCEVSIRDTTLRGAGPTFERKFAYSNFDVASESFEEQLVSLGVLKRKHSR